MVSTITDDVIKIIFITESNFDNVLNSPTTYTIESISIEIKSTIKNIFQLLDNIPKNNQKKFSDIIPL